jgi:hypothetical protein
LREPTIAIIGRISTARAAHAEQRRRSVKCGQPWRIAGLARRDQADAELPAACKFAAGLGFATDAARTRRAAAPREIRQPLQRGAGAAEMAHQRTERPRPDMIAADQPQPVDPLGVG